MMKSSYDEVIVCSSHHRIKSSEDQDNGLINAMREFGHQAIKVGIKISLKENPAVRISLVLKISPAQDIVRYRLAKISLDEDLS